MNIRESVGKDLFEIEKVHSLAFSEGEGPVIVELVHNLFKDKSAKPYFSLVAVEDEKIVGHILFTKVIIPDSNISSQILAPLAVLSDNQGKGAGGRLIREGLSHLKEEGVGLVFTLGYPKYYTRFGFVQAGAHDFEAPYSIPEKNQDAWMVQELTPGVLGEVKGKIKCAESLNKPEYWAE